jgi:MFS family permease
MPDPHSTTRIDYRLIAACTMGPFLVSVDATALMTAMPELAHQLDTSLSLASLAFVLYTLMFAGLILPLGWLMDRLDCFRLLRSGYLLFALGSLACTMSGTILQLCAGRILQGIGGAVLYAVTPVLVKRAMPADAQDQGYAWNAMSAQIGILAGPPLGGLITSHWGWQWIFGLNLPLAALGLLLLQQRTAPPAGNAVQKTLDLPGAVLSFLASALCIFALNQGKELGWSSWPILLAGIGGPVCLALFARRQFRLPNPLIDLGLIRIKTFRTALLVACTGMFAGAGLSFLYPFFLTRQAGLSLGQTGLFLSIEPTCSVLLGSCAAAASLRWGYAPVIASSMVVRLFGALLLAAVAGVPSLLAIGLAFILAGGATGLQYGPLMSRIMVAVPADLAGAGAALFSQSRLMAQMMGIVLFEALYSELHDLLPHYPMVSSVKGIDFMTVFLLAATLFAVSAVLSRRLQEQGYQV